MAHLNDKQIRFCDEYLIDFNASAAARRAGYSARSAHSQAHDLLKKPEVQAYLTKKKEKVATKLEVSMERTLLEIARVAYSDPRNLFEDDGRMKNIKDLDADTAAVISSIEVDELLTGITLGDQEEGKDNESDDEDEDAEKPVPIIATPQVVTKKVKLWSKLQALGLLADHFGIKKPAPPPVTQFNISSLSDNDLKALQALKQKAAK